MKPAAIVNQIAELIRRKLRQRSDTAVCLAFMTLNPDGSHHVDLALPGDMDRTFEPVFVAEALLRNAGDAILAGGHPDCENCREKLRAITAARVALGFEESDRPEFLS